MTLDEFKFIYNMEWGHRALGRVIGALFLIKTISFNITGNLAMPVRLRMGAILAMLGGQGLLGWYSSSSSSSSSSN